MRAVVTQLPNCQIIYVADSANCPYGRHSPSEIRGLSVGITRFLLDQGAQMIIVACNTASAAALTHLRATFPRVPFVGMVPAVKPAVSLSHQGVVGVLATPVTMKGQLLSDVLEKHATNSKVLTRVCAGLVEQIEAGRITTPDTREMLRRCLEPMIERGMDTLVLGCTHYPFVIPLIRRLAGPHLHIVTAGEAVAQQAQRVLRQQIDQRVAQHPPAYRFVVTTDAGRFRRMRNMLVPSLDGPIDEARWRGTKLQLV